MRQAQRAILKSVNTKRHYTLALTRNVPQTMSQALSSSTPSSPFSLSRAMEQHNTYVSALRNIVPTFTLPADDQYPDCTFIEDTAIVVGNRGLITQLGAQSRRGEVDAVKTWLEAFGIHVTDMRDFHVTKDHQDTIPKCDGGDVLLPVQNRKDFRRDIFVGLSARTNKSGLHVLQTVFQDMTIIPVPVPHEIPHCLHLKSFMTLLDENTLLVPTGTVFDSILREIQVIERGYDVIRLPNPKACNVASIHNHVISPHFADMDDNVECIQILEKACQIRGLILHSIDSSEFEKFDGACTCKSILISF